ncbi:DUF397 domain-containing protein [Streptomyces sp. NPDC020379]|uniref:DUF397 domain-containing protein n=1 Tax=Streptomyces sp. NPDC020379 TaxID=3365071 RepID=UPI0037A0F788
MTPGNWQQSSYCSEGDACLNITTSPNGTLLLRESDNPTTVLTLTVTQFRTLIRMLKGQIR